MQQQNYKNHSRLVPGFHGFAFLLILCAIVGAVVNVFTSEADDLFQAVLILVITVVLLLLAWYARIFALKVQDRAIRAEENLRYYALTGKRLPVEIRMSQVIALRFAPDEEFVELVARAVAEPLSARQIKQAIVHWKADHHRA